MAHLGLSLTYFQRYFYGNGTEETDNTSPSYSTVLALVI